MNALPWYKSPVFVGAVVSIISQLLVLIGKQDLIPIDVLTRNVEALFQFIALGAGLYSAWKRKTSDIQPLTITKKAADDKNQAGFARLSMLMCIWMTLGLITISACVTTPVDVVKVACQDLKQNPDRCAKGIAETWEVYQKRGEELVTDTSTPIEVKQRIQSVERGSRPIIVGLLKSAAEYRDIKVQFSAAGTTDAETNLILANQNLAEWVNRALPVLKEFGAALGIK